MEKRTMLSSTGMIKRMAARFGLASALLLFACTAQAQDGSHIDTGPADKQTPPALAPGAPAGSYALSGFDNVNLFNGNLNFVLPLVHIGGRGEAGYTIALALNSKGWNVRRTATHSHNEDQSVFFTPHEKPWPKLEVGFSAGAMVGRYGGEGHLNDTLGGVPQQPCPAKSPLYEYTYTRLTFTAADGTEFEFRDQLSGGQPQAVPFAACFNPIQGFDRGKAFVTFDGTAATFISDIDITDQNISTFTTFLPSGYLFLSNGMRYRIANGEVQSIQDRNGNQVTFDAAASRPTTPGVSSTFNVTDPLGRVTKVEYNISDPTYGFGDRITYPGFNNKSRVLFIVRSSLSDALRSDQTLKNYTDLFPPSEGLNGSANFSPNIYNPQQIFASAVYLPDGRRYRFLYNSYGELARVELPTGGAYEYDMVLGSGVISTDGGGCSEDPEYEIYRRVAERRTLPDGVNIEGRTTYTENAAAGTVTVDHLDHSHGDKLLTREIHYFNGNAALELFAPRPAFTFWDEGKEFQTDTQDGAGKLLRSTKTNLQQAGPVSWFTAWLNSPIKGTTCYNYGSLPANNPRNLETDTTLADANPIQTAKETFTYDQFNNVLEKDEFDFGASSPTRTTVDTYLTSQMVGGVSVDYVDPNVTVPTSTIHQRRLVTSTTITGVGPTLITNHNYDEAGSAIADAPGIVNHDSSYSSSYLPRGNNTSTTQAGLTSKITFDIAGNIISSTDLNNNLTTYTYDLAQGGYAFISKTTFPIADPSGSHASGSVLAVTQIHDFNTGALTSFTDPNSQITRFDYTDPLDRVVSITHPDQSSTTYIYGDTVGDLYLHTVTSLDGARNLESYSYFDGLGRPIRRLHFDGTAATPWIATETFYDAMGRTRSVSNPHRVSVPSAVPDQCLTSVPCTTTDYDALSRITKETTPDGQVATTSYFGSRASTTDQAGLTKDLLHDAFNRLVQVTENPTNVNGDGSPVTTYTYDLENNLLCVHQKGLDTTADKPCKDPGVPLAWRERSFTYDQFSHLLTTSNPESGTVQYTYDNNGNVTTRQDARGIITTYTYDAWNREVIRSYKNDTDDPANSIPCPSDPSRLGCIEHFYDGIGNPGATNALGRLSKVTSVDASSGSYSYDNYDAMGRVLGTTQTVDNQPYQMLYTYDQAGNLISEKYPSGRTVVTGTDAAGRPSSLTSSLDMKPYADPIQYSAYGGITNLHLGNGLWEHITYDGSLNDTSPLGRFQPTEISVGTSPGASDKLDVQYDYGSATNNNNGSVRREVIVAPGSPGLAVTQLIQYDGFNRLLKMQEDSGSTVTTWQQTAIWEQDFTHDVWGNRSSLSSTPSGLLTSLAPAVDTNNRIDVTKDSRYAYDAAGNLKQEPAGLGTNCYTYNAEGDLIRAQELPCGTVGSAVQTFKYDPLGNRVKKIAASTTGTTVYVHDASGRLIAEYNPAITSTNGTRYLTQDMLGSTRLLTDANGVDVARYDYLPYGELIPTGLATRQSVTGYGNNSAIQQKFISKPHEDESGLDYFGARYYSSTTGRFIIADWSSLPTAVPFAHFDNPQTLNLYIYPGNPTTHADLDGHQNPSGRPSPPTKAELKALRQAAVAEAWRQEKRLVQLTGSGTENWNARQIAQLKQGITPTDAKGRTFIGHHGKSVNGHPQYAGVSDNIHLKSYSWHKEYHMSRGGYQVKTNMPFTSRSKLLAAAEKAASLGELGKLASKMSTVTTVVDIATTIIEMHRDGFGLTLTNGYVIADAAKAAAALCGQEAVGYHFINVNGITYHASGGHFLRDGQIADDEVQGQSFRFSSSQEILNDIAKKQVY